MVARAKVLSDRMGRRRVQHRFDLNLNKEDEYQLDEMIQSLKKKRSFLGVIRDGIRLILDLRQGQTEVLRELFPWVLEQEIQFEELKQLVMQRTALQPASSSLNISDDEDDVVVKERAISDDFNPGWNLPLRMASMAGNFSMLTPEMIWYGIRNGLINVQSALQDGLLTYQQIAEGINAGKINKEKLPKAIVKEVDILLGAGGPKKIAGADVEFSEPDYDDIEIDF